MKLWLTVDPGENTGWSIWRGSERLTGGQDPLKNFIDTVGAWAELGVAKGDPIFGVQTEALGAIVCEDWVLYENGIENLAWDKCRTARGIGALEYIARRWNIPIILQAALIKEAALAAGAEEMFVTPKKENRHENDSIMHGVFYLAKEGKPPC